MRKLCLLAGAFLVLFNAGPSAADQLPDTLSSPVLFQIAEEAVKNRGWTRAREALEKWLKKEQPTVQALFYLGEAQLYLKDEKDAEKSFKQVLDRDKANLEALDGLCEVYLIRNRAKDMQKTLERMKKIAPASRKVRYYEAMGADKFSLKGYPETFFWDTLEELVRQDSSDVQTLSVLCDAYINDRFLERGILFLTELQDKFGDRSEYYFQLARIYANSGDKDLARDFFRKIAEEEGIDKLTPRQRFMMSVELFALEEDAMACDAYFSAARNMDDQLAQEVFNDLKDLTISDQRREFEYTPSGRKGIWLISFWGRKDPTPTTLKNERLVEHYRRIRFVRKEYYSPLRPGYDERGRVYIKHGEPDQKISLNGNWAIRDNESWLYSKNRSNSLIYNFVARNNFYRIAYSLEEALIPDLQTEMNNGGRNVEELFRSRGELDPKYNELANEMHNFQGGSIEDAKHTYMMDLFNDESMLTERGLTEGETTETFEFKQEDEPMNYYYFPVALKGPDTLSSLGVFFGLPTDQVKVPDPFGTVEIPVELEVVIYDSWWQEVARVKQDKTYRVPNFVASKENLIPDLLSLQLKPGNYHMATRLKQTQSNLMQIYQSNFSVDSYTGTDTLHLSDLILATDVQEDSRPSKFSIRGYRISPMPSASFTSEMPIFVYYEMYNLHPDSSGTKRIRVDYLISSSNRSLSAARKIINALGRFIGVREEVGKVVTTFEQDIRRPGGIDPIYISVDPTGYVPGNYSLMVTVTDTVSGQSASKDVTFLISK